MVEICEHAGTWRMAAMTMEEILGIEARVGSTTEISIEKRLRGAAGVGHHKTSMLQDLEAGKPLELGAIVSAALQLADLTRAGAPTLSALPTPPHLLARAPAPPAA